jgi:hypothetical protein
VGAVRRWASDGVDLVLDAVGLDTLLPHAVDVVKPGVSFVEIETLISQASERQMSVAAAKGVRIVSNMVAINRLPEHLAKLALLYADGMAVPPAIELIPLVRWQMRMRRSSKAMFAARLHFRFRTGQRGDNNYVSKNIRAAVSGRIVVQR